MIPHDPNVYWNLLIVVLQHTEYLKLWLTSNSLTWKLLLPYSTCHFLFLCPDLLNINFLLFSTLGRNYVTSIALHRISWLFRPLAFPLPIILSSSLLMIWSHDLKTLKLCHYWKLLTHPNTILSTPCVIILHTLLVSLLLVLLKH